MSCSLGSGSSSESESEPAASPGPSPPSVGSASATSESSAAEAERGAAGGGGDFGEFWGFLHGFCPKEPAPEATESQGTWEIVVPRLLSLLQESACRLTVVPSCCLWRPYSFAVRSFLPLFSPFSGLASLSSSSSPCGCCGSCGGRRCRCGCRCCPSSPAPLTLPSSFLPGVVVYLCRCTPGF